MDVEVHPSESNQNLYAEESLLSSQFISTSQIIDDHEIGSKTTEASIKFPDQNTQKQILQETTSTVNEPESQSRLIIESTDVQIDQKVRFIRISHDVFFSMLFFSYHI